MNAGKTLSLFAVSVSVIAIGYYVYSIYGTGTLIVKLKDPPTEWGPATDVYIRCRSVSIHRAEEGEDSGWFKVMDSRDWVNLKEALNSTKIIGNNSLQAGWYNILRFEIDASMVTVNGKNYTSTVESGKMTIAITQGGVVVYTGQTTSVIIDITPKVVGTPRSGFKIVPAAKAFPEK